MTEGIYIHTANKEKLRRIHNTALLLGLTVSELHPTDLKNSVGNITGMPDIPPASDTIPLFYNMPEVLLFSGLSNPKLDAFLALYRKSNIEPIALKAVITPFNCTWSLYKLIEELKKEHEAMNK